MGPRTLLPLLRNGADVAALAEEPPPDFTPRQREAVRSVSEAALERSMGWLEDPNCHLVPFGSRYYPERLAALPDAPVALFVLGDPGLLGAPQIAIVGSRNPTRGGIQTAQEFARHFSANGITVTSGLALGIDSAAHRGALQGSGGTIAVTGTGLDRVYPAANRELAGAIAKRGALVSEFPPGTAAKAGHFPRRNRIISGLSLGVLVVEAALKSGSLITARQAGEQGREVFAIPGSIHNPLARGCHRLIRQGAKLVEQADDVLEELAPQLRPWLEKSSPEKQQEPEPEPQTDASDPDYQNLLDAMGFDPVSTDTLVARTGLPAEVVSSMLLLLEMEDVVTLAPGGLYCRRPPSNGTEQEF